MEVLLKAFHSRRPLTATPGGHVTPRGYTPTR
jgi:hypothetical protein